MNVPEIANLKLKLSNKMLPRFKSNLYTEKNENTMVSDINFLPK